MAVQLNNEKVRMGTVLPVRNQKQKFGAARVYFAIKVESEDGRVEQWLMLTVGELEKLPVYDCGEWTEELKKGRLYPFSKEGQAGHKYLLALKTVTWKPDQYEGRIVLLGDKLLEKAAQRAQKNAEDIPEQCMIADLLD